MFDPASVRVRGPLRAHVAGFWVDLLRQGYAPLSAANQLRVAAHLGRWLEDGGLALGGLTEEVVTAFLRHRRRCRYTRFYTRRGLEPLLGYLRGVGAAPRPTVETTQIYLDADLAMKERALARTASPGAGPGRFRPRDSLLAFLEGL